MACRDEREVCEVLEEIWESPKRSGKILKSDHFEEEEDL